MNWLTLGADPPGEVDLGQVANQAVAMGVAEEAVAVVPTLVRRARHTSQVRAPQLVRAG